ncbi:hypothetical protein CICLE_v10027307mg [Citrus x clementina]|uniref:Uncharacterized protein n=1 Tax=Citrus clementina TaxID=85681 RepID=V4SJT9_CITCL|nr:hypothetical protein CICLE_v10027307mg [Citrus x clementina]
MNSENPFTAIAPPVFDGTNYQVLFEIVNKIRLIGTDFSDSRVVQKILVKVPEKFEAIISSLENSRDLSSITLAELLNALQALEQRRLMRQEKSTTFEHNN